MTCEQIGKGEEIEIVKKSEKGKKDMKKMQKRLKGIVPQKFFSPKSHILDIDEVKYSSFWWEGPKIT